AQVAVRVDEAPPQPVYARAEELLCYSILANVVKNAIEATPRGGAVTIRLEAEDAIRVRVHNPGRVPAGIVGRFFDKYVTGGKNRSPGRGACSRAPQGRGAERGAGDEDGPHGPAVDAAPAAAGRRGAARAAQRAAGPAVGGARGLPAAPRAGGGRRRVQPPA